MERPEDMLDALAEGKLGGPIDSVTDGVPAKTELDATIAASAEI